MPDDVNRHRRQRRRRPPPPHLHLLPPRPLRRIPLALTLRLLGGLTTDEIARAFLVPEPTIAQRIVRAKRTLTEARVPFEVPRGLNSPPASPPSSKSSTSSSTRATPPPPATTGSAPPSAKKPSASAVSSPNSSPTNPKSTASSPSWRSRPRAPKPASAPPANPSSSSIRTARAGTSSSSAAASPHYNTPSTKRQSTSPRPLPLQAAIAACHARAVTPKPPTGPASPPSTSNSRRLTPRPSSNSIAPLPSPWPGPQAGLDIVDTLTDEPSLKNYHLLPSVRGDLLVKLDRHNEARAEFERAASLTRNTRERDLLLQRAKDCDQPLPTE